jgi:hydroxymethylglutaryl-CoA lyase
MQGIHEFIPTEVKVKYLNGLLRVGYDTIDIGSFVSPTKPFRSWPIRLKYLSA